MRARRVSLAALVAAVTVTGALAALHPAAAAPVHGARAQAVVSGDARFEVLSPTLIRMEYAGDAQFVDAPTFNAIGRDGFARTSYTSKTLHGWLEIDTDAVQLRYKVGSGPFTAKNVSVRLEAGEQTVTARPSFGSVQPCVVGQLCEAEDGQLTGVSTATDHQGYTGSSFVAGFTATGAALSYPVTVAQSGSYAFQMRYANNQGGDGQTTTRTLSLSVDGVAPQTLSLPPTASWDTWAVVTAGLDLSAGTHTITVARDADDSGNVNVDSLAVTAPGASYPAPSSTVQSCAYGSVCEAETGTLAGGADTESNHNDYSGTGFAAGLTAAGASDTVHVTGVPRAGTYALQIRYANAVTPGQAGGSRTVSVQAGVAAATTATLAPTSSWDAWRTVAVPVTLTAGADDVVIGCPTSDSCHVNIDTVAVTRKSAPLLAPHAPLGGYRRSLDGVNGAASTTPGLLYQDGWTLLDDTTSAIFDTATQQVSQRPTHDGKPYQDDYLFGYGHDYTQGLHDLATLTGPSELLPRWAYGVWYSEYYDRTAADYEDTILPKFRTDKVPLDVLVTDTDYKSPDTWDGWEIDPAKFPDPKAFFDWAQSQGLHNTMNIHPSIVSTDAQYAAAQATAHGGLIQNNGGCNAPASAGDCYVFDWGKADQLKAYFDLHQTMEQQGVDFWWLDWCCENSESTLPGVTPDAWINQQYANDSDKLIGRGFAFSRAFGSLQAGGYSGQQGLPTGPWADKRTTVHFTGDTTSSWATLANEVGYTPGEAASTGLSATSHDIGGFNNDGTQAAGAEPGSTKLPDDLYARWVQLGAFQPILRLHGNHSDRLPWQYGDAAKTSAEKFLNLREDLVPYTYSLAQQANATGVPTTRPTYLEYPDQQDAYAASGGEYFYGSDVLVAPATSPGTTATTSVWIPPGQWTDYFTGKTYTGPSTQDVTSGLDTMPVFVKAGGIVPMRAHDVTNDDQNPLTSVALTVAGGASGSYSLYEDDGSSTDPSQSATTKISYVEGSGKHTVRIAGAVGSFTGQVSDRSWVVRFTNATAPSTVRIDGQKVSADSWTWDPGSRTVTVQVPTRSVRSTTVVSYL